MKRVLLFFILVILSISVSLSLTSCEDSDSGNDVCNIGDIQQGGCN